MARTTFSGPVYSTNGFVGAITLTDATATTLTVSGATALNGGLTMDTNKFVVANTSGNTTIGGTLDVTGAATLSSAANVLVIPTSDPGVAGAIWYDAPDLKISAGV